LFQKLFTYLTVTLIVLLFSSCTGVNLQQNQIIVDKDDWLMAGGSTLQQNIARSVLEPPLYLKWTYDCDAGLGYQPISAADEIVFINTLQGEMHSIDIPTGGKIGQLNFLGKDANTTPLIDGNTVIVSFAGDKDYSLAAYDMLNTDIVWRINLGYLQTSPVLADSCIYVGGLNGKFYKVDKKDGTIIWEKNVNSAIHSTAALSNDKVVFGSDDGYIYALNISDGIEAWKYKTDNSVFAAPMINNEQVYIGSYDSNYYCLNLDSGRVKWKTNLKTKIHSGTALFHDTSLLAGGIDGNLYSLNIDNGAIDWSFTTKGVITSTPLISGNNVYFSSYDWKTYCVDARSGKMLWSFDIDGKGKTSSIIWKNYLFVAADKNLYCFTNNADEPKK
jgi:outer membrane protein assembly factor BamB